MDFETTCNECGFLMYASEAHLIRTTTDGDRFFYCSEECAEMAVCYTERRGAI